jgi:ABC-type branched-subunit amino acid transport system substrate-binding protein
MTQKGDFHHGLLGMILTLAVAGCAQQKASADSEASPIGVALPFTGDSASIGQNLERALQLAIEDVNRASSKDARKLRLEIRDSNSGSQRGLDALLDLLYQEQVEYLIGPEENQLATEIVPDIKGLGVLNVFPGYASPPVQRVGFHDGAWLRLPPTTVAFGCGIAQLARSLKTSTANIVVTQDDFNQAVSSDFASEFVFDGGRLLPSFTVKDGESSYVKTAMKAASAGADRTLLFAEPKTASRMVTESAVAGRQQGWLLGPMLNTPGFLGNVPSGVLKGSWGVSPTLSLSSECEQVEDEYGGPVKCSHENADAFADHFASRWDGERPFPAAHFYYDAVVLLAMGLEYARGKGFSSPTASELQSFIVKLSQASERGAWNDLEASFSKLSQGVAVTYVGAAAIYEFDQYGAATHVLFDSWTIDHFNYESGDTLRSQCAQIPRTTTPQ